VIAKLVEQGGDREREIAELQALLAEKDRELVELRNELAWEQATRKHFESIAEPATG
jgi:hypothetical protein